MIPTDLSRDEKLDSFSVVILFYFLVFNALLTQKIVTTVYKNRKVKRESNKKEKKKRGLSLHIQHGNIIA